MVLEAGGDETAQVAARGVARVAGRVDPGPVAQHAGEEVVGAAGQLGGDPLGARRLRRGAEQQLADDEAGALGEQLHRRVGMGHARRAVVGDDDRARQVGAGQGRVDAAPVREHAAQLAGGRMDDDDVAARRGFGGALEERARRSAGIDEADRQAARGEVGDLRRQPLDARAEIDHRHLAGRAGALAGVDDEDACAALGERGAEALEQDAAADDVRIRDDGNEAGAGAGEHLAQAGGLVVTRRDRHGIGAGESGRRRDQAPSALPAAAAGAVAKTRFISAASRRQAALPPPRIARCTSAFADRRCQSSGTRWPLATPTTVSLWRIAASSAGPSLIASSSLLRTTPAQLARAVGDQHVLDRLALRRRVDDEQALHAAVRDHLEQLLGPRVALRHAGGVDQDHLLGGQQVEQVLERGAVVRGVHRHAEDAAVGAQLLVGADAVGVERDQAEVGGAVAGGEGGGDLGRRRRLADAGGADQREHAAAVLDRLVGSGGAQVLLEDLRRPLGLVAVGRR